jgi:DNA invertase Pin-like site-specific DNA recombinase
MNFSEHITIRHKTLKAIVYIRQSTPNQVKNNQESQKLQHALKDRAIQFGWPLNGVEILDSDLGITATNTEDRAGIQYLISQVARGEVGIIFCYEVSRLMRNCSDWYPLLDICSYKKTLIGDKDGVYDPNTPNGRLILGFKGQIAEIELNTMKGRMHEGVLNKAKRGDLIRNLPTGLVCLQKGIVTKDPNIEVQNCIRNIFEVFFKVKSGSKVVKFFNENNLKVPRYKNNELMWRKPTNPVILNIIKNPAYAGASVYGRTETIVCDFNSKKKRKKSVPMEQWKYVVKEKFPAYISWETFELIQSMLKENYSEYKKNKTKGIPRSGKALLHGIMYCGCCSHKMVIQYKKYAYYICNALKKQQNSPLCQYISSDQVDEYVVEVFFQALSPIELNAYEKIVEEQWHRSSTVSKMKEQQIERLSYQAKLAERQFNQVDPDNRLVASELERRWELALNELKLSKLDQKLDILKHENNLSKLPLDLKNAFISLGKELPGVWEKISQGHKKAFLRCLIDKVVVCRKISNILEVRIVWVGGETTTKDITVPIRRYAELPYVKELEEKIIQLSGQDINDQFIADKLTKEGYKSAMSKGLLVSTVRKIRLKHGIMRRTRSASKPSFKLGYTTVSQLAKRHEVDISFIYHRIKKGLITVSKDPTTGRFLFPDNAETDKMIIELKKNK